MGYYGWGWHGSGFMWIFPVLFLGIVLFALFMFRGSGSHGQSDHREKDESALDILDKRFARGEIDQAKYDEMRQVLRH